MIHKEEGGGSPQIKVDIQRMLGNRHVTMHVIAPTGSNIIPNHLNIVPLKARVLDINSLKS